MTDVGGHVTALVVDPDEQGCAAAREMLEDQGIDSGEAATMTQARSQVAESHFDLVLAQSVLADGTGAELLAELGREQPGTATILIGGEATGAVPEDALIDGVDDYMPQAFSAEALSISVTRALRRRMERSSAGQAQQTPENGERAAPHDRLAEEVLDCLTRAGRFRDEETSEHVERVSRSAALIGQELGLSAEKCRTLRAASAMHDIGKIGVPDSILGKPGKLNAEERAVIERHAEIGHQILSGSDDPVLDLAATIAWGHHEWVDGKGYPRGLADDEIPLEARITAAADVFDALTHDRVYRPALEIPAALRVMQEGNGTHFDGEVLAAMLAALPEIEKVRELYSDSTSLDADLAGIDSETGSHPLRVLVVEDHAAVARGLALLLRREGMEIAGMAASLPEGERLIADRDADVVILDGDLQGENGLRLIPGARARGARVLLYTGGAGQASGPADEVPDGIASKLGGPTELLAAVRELADGGAPSDERVKTPGSASASPLLTPREREITALLAVGHTGEDIAVRLFLSHHTVRTHIRNAMTSASARTRPHLIALALESGEITVDPGPAPARV